MTAAERFVKRMLVGFSATGATTKAQGTGKGRHKTIDDDLERRQSALETAIRCLENEPDTPDRNPFSKGWAVKAGYRRDGTKIKEEKGKSKSTKEQLFEALVEDESPQDKTLQEHDKERHPDGFNPETDTCKFRERMSTETEEDKGDILDSGKSGKPEAKQGNPSPAEIPNVQQGTGNANNQRVYKGLSNKQVKKYQALMEKKHPELDADLVLTELGKIADRKVQECAFGWAMKGAIKLPEDTYKVEDALKRGEDALNAYTGAKKTMEVSETTIANAKEALKLAQGDAKKEERARQRLENAEKRIEAARKTMDKYGAVSFNPMDYDTPMGMIEAMQGFKKGEKPITVEELKKNPLMSDYRDEGYGVETLEVDDSPDGQKLMRQVINTHWGKDANPWCLLHGDGEGNLSDGSDGGYDAWQYWEHYNALPKRVAFKDGKLLAFMATDKGEMSPEAEELREEYEESDYYLMDDMSFEEWLKENYPDINPTGEQWWDRQDKSHKGIPIGIGEIPNDKYKRKGERELVSGKIEVPQNQKLFAGEEGKPGYKLWDKKGNLTEEINEVGDFITYWPRGKDGKFIPLEIKRVNGNEEKYNPDGVMDTLIKYDKDGNATERIRWEIDEEGNRYLSERQTWGRNPGKETFYPDGSRAVKVENDVAKAWYKNGFKQFEDVHHNGKWLRIFYTEKGEVGNNHNYPPEVYEKYRQTGVDPEAKPKEQDTTTLPNGKQIPSVLSYLYKDMKGNLHDEKWSVAREKATGDGRISQAFSDTLDKLFGGSDVSDEEIMALPEWKEALEKEKEIEGRLTKEYGVSNTNAIDTPERRMLREAIVNAALSKHITKTVPVEGLDGVEFETNEGLEDNESYDVENGKKVFIAIGLPAAGKSTTFANPLAKKYKARLCDSDTVKKVLPEFANGFGGNLVHEESTEINERILGEAVERGENIVYPILGYKADKLKNLFRMFKDHGYEVNLCFKDQPANIAKGRLLGRFLQKGRYLPLTCISKAQGKVGHAFDEVKELADAYIRNTSDAQGRNEKTTDNKGSLL